MNTLITVIKTRIKIVVSKKIITGAMLSLLQYYIIWNQYVIALCFGFTFILSDILPIHPPENQGYTCSLVRRTKLSPPVFFIIEINEVSLTEWAILV